ncbi:MAG: ATP-binding cassette domain-containing protein, partial [Alphaproteobacteria bacterium]
MITLENVSKTYEGASKIVALRDVSIDVKEGEFLVILGPSGAGKSTLMRCINRLVEPTSGRILLDGREVTSRRRQLRAARRDIGMV